MERKKLEQSMVSDWSKLDGMVLVCGRYEGVDERFIEQNNFLQISLGDFILMGGEIASMATTEAVIRLLPGVLGNQKSLEEESFNNDILEYPQYTRPRIWKNMNVPQILLSGNHKEIKKWREKN
jgi:tRNA (guanine37-N1)-methyltransferase